MNILVTGVGGPAGINTLSCMPNSVNVFGCDSDSDAIKRISTAGLKVPIFYKVPLASDDDFLESIKNIVRKNEIDVIIPTVDEELIILSENHVDSKVVVSPMNTVNTCNDKYILYEKLKDYDFCPVYTLGGSDIGIYGKIFVKPRIGRGGRGTSSFESGKEILSQYLTNKYVMCEYLPGEEYTVDAMCDFDGNLIYAVPRIRTKVIKGISVKGKTQRNEEIIKHTREICKVLKFVGPINLQFKLDEHSKAKLVEINPRFSGGLPITVSAGINPVEILLDVIEGKTIEEKRLEWNEIETDNIIMRRLRI